MEVVPQNTHWLFPEEPAPCEIFIHHRGQYEPVLQSGQAVDFKLLEKLANTHCDWIYIKAGDLSGWNEWAKQRYPKARAAEEGPRKKDEESISNDLYGNKRAELLSYMQKCLTKKVEGDVLLDRAFVQATQLVQKIIQQPTLDWYFRQFHEPPDLFHHNGRVAFGLALFLSLHRIVDLEEAEAICYSALIHELEGSPVENMKSVVSQQTLALLEAKKHPVPKKVIELIRLHDELCSGKGFPENKSQAAIPVSVRAFTLFNHFDAYRLQSKGTRRAKFDKAKAVMAARASDYDSHLLPDFWKFWEKQVEPMG